MIVVDPVKCTNCRMCELACSLVKIAVMLTLMPSRDSDRTASYRGSARVVVTGSLT
jgi:Fe-S-cluster-containing dehydrogenase component